MLWRLKRVKLLHYALSIKTARICCTFVKYMHTYAYVCVRVCRCVRARAVDLLKSHTRNTLRLKCIFIHTFIHKCNLTRIHTQQHTYIHIHTNKYTCGLSANWFLLRLFLMQVFNMDKKFSVSKLRSHSLRVLHVQHFSYNYTLLHGMHTCKSLMCCI